jgi:mRNA interferase MazF
MIVERGRLYIANLNPGFGTEAGKTRPVIVLQSDFLNQADHPSAIICPVTTQVRKEAPLFRVHLPKGTGGLQQDSDAMIDQIRAVDNRRFREALGKLPPAYLTQILTKLQSMLDIGWL